MSLQWPSIYSTKYIVKKSRLLLVSVSDDADVSALSQILSVSWICLMQLKKLLNRNPYMFVKQASGNTPVRTGSFITLGPAVILLLPYSSNWQLLSVGSNIVR